jgi:hypothetical protein
MIFQKSFLKDWIPYPLQKKYRVYLFVFLIDQWKMGFFLKKNGSVSFFITSTFPCSAMR